MSEEALLDIAPPSHSAAPSTAAPPRRWQAFRSSKIAAVCLAFSMLAGSITMFVSLAWRASPPMLYAVNQSPAPPDNPAGQAWAPSYFSGKYNHSNSLLTSRVMRRFYTAATDPLAVCNDGSTGVFYHRPGTGNSTNKWVIRYMGGAWCWDQASCDARFNSTPYLMSSSLCADTMSLNASMPGVPDVVAQPGGILSTSPLNNPDFHAWNHVYVWYCSSDSHLGDAWGPAANATRWQFRGKRITRATIHQLLQNHSLGDATDVLVTGDSAGGVGAMNNAALIRSMVEPHANRLIRFKAFIDAGWFLDLPSYSSAPNAFSFQMCAKALRLLWNATFDDTCSRAYPNEAWKCFHAQYCHSKVPMPLLFHEYLYDSANLGYDAASGNDFEPFRAQMVASLTSSAAPGPTYHAPSPRPPGPAPAPATPPAPGNDSSDASAAAAEAAPASDVWPVQRREPGGYTPLQQPLVVRGMLRRRALTATVEQPQTPLGRRLLAEALPAGLVAGDGSSVAAGLASSIMASMHGLNASTAAALARAGVEAAGLAGQDAAALFGTGANHAAVAAGSDASQQASGAGTLIFAPACFLHEMIDSSLFTASRIGGLHLHTLLDEWFHDGARAGMTIVDNTPGMRSAADCSGQA